ncbi:hypothetical protein NQ317_004829, partial [Molorchus minor]
MLLALEKTRGNTQVKSSNKDTSVSPSIEPSTSREQVTLESTDPVAPVPGDKKIIQTEVILSTALVQVVNWQGYPVTCRALLDNGSQSNLITEEMCERLGLERQNVE